MKKNRIRIKESDLVKVIKKIINEQNVTSPWGDMTTQCIEGPNCVPPTLETNVPFGGGGLGGFGINRLRCPDGFMFQGYPSQMINYSQGQGQEGQFMVGITNCIPDTGSPGDMAGHGSTDDPFVPGMGFEDQFIDQITGPDGPWGGGKGDGKSIKEQGIPELTGRRVTEPKTQQVLQLLGNPKNIGEAVQAYLQFYHKNSGKPGVEKLPDPNEVIQKYGKDTNLQGPEGEQRLWVFLGWLGIGIGAWLLSNRWRNNQEDDI